MITIVGMKMPENCSECPMQNNYGNFCVLHDGVPAHHQSDTDRPSWCPLADVSFPEYCRHCGKRL